MDNAQLAGRLLIAALPGPDLPPAVEAAIRDLRPTGVILFDRNIKSESQLRELTGAFREVLGSPALIAVDLEGGRVNRLRGLHPAFAALPPGIDQAQWETARIEEVWEQVGRALTALGFDLDFHPPVDLDDSDGSNAIGNRSFGTDPRVVTRVAGAALAGLERAGVIGCLKHFPGLGGTTIDTHEDLAASPLTADDLWDRHLVPYRELSAAAPMVMTAHAHYPQIDGPAPLPGTYSERLLGEWLRERIGFDGVVISDDLMMGAVAKRGTAGERALSALRAGCDMVMFCQDLDAPRRGRDLIASALDKGDLDRGRAQESLARVMTLLARYPGARGGKVTKVAYEEAVKGLASLLRV